MSGEGEFKISCPNCYTIYKVIESSSFRNSRSGSCSSLEPVVFLEVGVFQDNLTKPAEKSS